MSSGNTKLATAMSVLPVLFKDGASSESEKPEMGAGVTERTTTDPCELPGYAVSNLIVSKMQCDHSETSIHSSGIVV